MGPTDELDFHSSKWHYFLCEHGHRTAECEGKMNVNIGSFVQFIILLLLCSCPSFVIGCHSFPQCHYRALKNEPGCVLVRIPPSIYWYREYRNDVVRRQGQKINTLCVIGAFGTNSSLRTDDEGRRNRDSRRCAQRQTVVKRKELNRKVQGNFYLQRIINSPFRFLSILLFFSHSSIAHIWLLCANVLASWYHTASPFTCNDVHDERINLLFCRNK